MEFTVGPNETEISCGGRESASIAGKTFESSQKLIAELPAVSFIDWLGLDARQPNDANFGIIRVNHSRSREL